MAGSEAVAESEDSFARTELVARWSRGGRGAYEAEIPLLFDVLIF